MRIDHNMPGRPEESDKIAIGEKRSAYSMTLAAALDFVQGIAARDTALGGYLAMYPLQQQSLAYDFLLFADPHAYITALNDLQPSDRNDNTDAANAQPPTSINEILRAVLIKMYHNGYTDHIAGVTQHAEPVMENWLKDTSTALYTLIASVRPKDKTVNERPYYQESERWGYNQALQDYDNAIKEVLK